MNRNRKEKIKMIYDELRRCLGELNDIHDEEEEYHDNIFRDRKERKRQKRQ